MTLDSTSTQRSTPQPSQPSGRLDSTAPIAFIPNPQPPPSLKRAHTPTLTTSPSLQPPVAKQLKYSLFGPPTYPNDLIKRHRGPRARKEEDSHRPLSRAAPPTGPAFDQFSLLGAAANAALNQTDSMATQQHSSDPSSIKNSPGSSIPIRTSPRSSRSGSERYPTPALRPTSDFHSSSGIQLLQSTPLTEYLQQDDRPTVVVDLADDTTAVASGLRPVFVNVALKSRPALFDHVRGRSEDPTLLLDLGTPFNDFKAWALSPLTEPDIVSTFPFGGFLWQSRLIRQQLRVIQGTPLVASLPSMADGQPRPTLHQYQGLGSASSTASNRAELFSKSYFDIPAHTSRDLPRTIQTLVVSDDASSSSDENLEPSSSTDTPYVNDAPSEPPLQSTVSVTMSPDIDLHRDTILTGALPAQGSFDWTRLPLSPSLPDHVRFARSIDWNKTSLGPIDQWSVDLRGMCNLIMASPHPSAMYWGREHVAIYNEAYILLAGQKHPALMGSRYRDAWAEIWDALGSVFDNAFENAQATMKDDDCLFIVRNGFLEETYFSWSIIPLIGDNGAVVGLYNPAFEKTRRKIAERRMLTLREIGERTAAARHVNQFWGLLLEGLEYNELDAPLVLIYSLNDDSTDSEVASSSSSGAASNKVCYLEGSLGVPPGHKAAPSIIDLKTSSKGFAASFRQALTTDRPIVLQVEDGTLDPEILEDIEWRGFGDPSKTVVIAPIHPTTGESTLGFLVMGTNPRRPYDEDYDLFVQLLGRQLATSIASVVLFEDEIKKSERAAQLAAQDRIELNNQLVARTQQAVEAEQKFTRMAELAPVGMFIGSTDGDIGFVNDTWYDLSSYPRGVQVHAEWIKYIVEEDQPKVLEMWSSMLKQKRPVSMEFRFKTPWCDKLGNKGPTWVLISISPERDEDGHVRRILGSMTDISAQKFSENLQTRRMEEAVELKRQQERYIDTTSHEMRNPLSAILQSADSITASLSDLLEVDTLTATQRDMVDSTIDSAQTITLCAQHQKRIVDDVLTLSKLDSAMMAVTPVDTQPVAVTHKVLKMFEAELKTGDITFELNLDPSFDELSAHWVRLDPHRLSQVLINLFTNAIKFTTMQENRAIRMHIAASTDKPSKEDKWKLTYIPSPSSKDKDITAAAEWGLGDIVYIHFAVQDTGQGLDELEKKQLFQRFQQASPRTHVTYGGSGLGLFISRELVELQGGEIGVASESGKGSIFAFYVKTRRSTRPPAGADTSTSASISRKGSRTAHLTRTKSQLVTPSQGVSVSLDKSSTSSALGKLQLNVLVVEDNLINQKVLATQLQKIGCVVYVANHGAEAIERIKKSKFSRDHISDGVDIDIVLMDLEMPVMDGQTCARKLREMQTSGELVSHIPVIAVTANARAEQIEMTLRSGIDDVVSKPFRIPELVPKMKDIVRKFGEQDKA